MKKKHAATSIVHHHFKGKLVDNKLLLIVIAVFIPPLAVFLKKGLGKDFLINLILTLLFFVPGMIHGLWVCTR